MVELFEACAKLTLNKDEFEKGTAEAKSGMASLATGAIVKGTLIANAITAGAKALFNFGKDAIQTGMDFEQAMGQVAATSGKTQGDLVDLRDQALELGRTTKFTATQAAEAMNTLAMAGYSANETMEVMPTTLNLAAAGALSIGEAADLTTGIMAGFSNEGLNMVNAVDQLAMLAASAKGSVSEFGAAINTAGAMASATGQKFETVAVAAGILGNHNMSASEAGNMLNRTMRNLYMPTTKAQKALKELGVSVFDSQGNARDLQDVLIDLKTAMSGMDDASRNAAMSQIFNAATLKSVGFLIEESDTRWNDLTDTLRGAWYTTDELNESLKRTAKGVGLNDIAKSLEKVGISADDMKTALRDSGGSVSQFLTSLDEISELDRKGIIEALPVSLADLQVAFENTRGAAERMKEAQEDTLKGDVTKFQSAWEGLQITIGDTMNGTARYITQLGTDLVSGFNDVLLSGGIVDAVHTLKTMLIDELNYMADDIRENLPDKIGNALDTVWKLLRGGGTDDTGLINAGANILSAIAQGIRDSIPTLEANIPLIFRAIADGFMSKTDALVELATGLMQNLGDGMVQGIPALLENLLPMLEQITGNLRENAGKMVDAGIELILKLGEGLINSLPTLIEYVPQIVTNIAGIINDNAPKLIMAAGKLLLMLGQGIIENIPVIIENAGSIVEAIWSVITAINWLNLGANILEGIGNGFSGMKEWFAGIIEQFKTDAFDLFTSWGETWSNLGKNLIEGLVNGVLGLKDWAIENIVNIGTSILDGFKSFFGISSPSTVMQEQGAYIVEGLVNGLIAMPEQLWAILTQALQSVMDWGAQMVANVTSTMSNFVLSIVTAASQIPMQLWTWLVQAANKVVEWGINLAAKGREAITKMKDAIVTAAASLPSKMMEIGRNIVKGVWNGISAMAGWFKSQVTGFFSGIVNGVKGALGIASPSKVFAEIGQYMAEGLGVGWDKAYDNVKEGIESGLQFENAEISSAMPSGGGNQYGGGYNQVVNIYSPEELSPWEVARQTKNATREMLLNFKGV